MIGFSVPQAPVVTARMVLRPFTVGDLDDLHAYQSIEEVTRYLYWSARTREESAASLAAKVAATSLGNEGDSIVLACELPAGPHGGAVARVIGEVNLACRSRRHSQGEIGFVFHPDFGGKGYATEAAAAMLALAFGTYGLHRVEGRLDARNMASARVMERVGMRREAHLRENELFKGEWGDEFVYAVLDREWAALAGSERG